MAGRRRQALGALLLLMSTLGVMRSGVAARATTSRAASWGTFAHLATNDLSTPTARQAAADAYDAIALRGALSADIVTDLHARRPGIVLLAYEKAAGLNNSEAAAHPDWVAHASNGSVIHPKSDNSTTLADLTNPEFRAWDAKKFADEAATGTDGVFIDTLGAFFPDEFYTGRPVVNGTAVTDAAWRDGSVDLINQIKSLTGRMVVANGFGLGTGNAYYASQANADMLIAAADAVQIENFTRSADAAPTTYRAADKWDQDIAFLDSLMARGKTAFVYTKVHSAATAAQLVTLRDYSLASFQLGYATGRAYFGFDDGAPIPTTPSDASWARSLGAPRAARTRAGTDGWTRYFINGVITLHAGGQPAVTYFTQPTTSTVGTTSTSAPTTTTVKPTTTTAAPTTTTVASTTTTVKATTTTVARTTTTTNGRASTTFTGSGAPRSMFNLRVGSGRVTATLTWSGGGYKTLGISAPNGAMAAGPATGTSPVVLDTTLGGGTYGIWVQGSAPAFSLRVDYPVPTTTVAAFRPALRAALVFWAALGLLGALLLAPVRGRRRSPQ